MEMADRKRTKEQNEKRRKGRSQIIEIEDAQRRRKEKRVELLKREKISRRREKAAAKASRPKMSGSKKLMVGGVLALAVLAFVFNGYRIVNLNLDKAVYENAYEEKLAEKARLETELTQVDDPAYIEQEARDRFHMLREGETLYIYPEGEAPEAQ